MKNTEGHLRIRIAALLAAILLFAPGGRARAETDFGDYTSEAITTRAWEAYGRQDYEAALVFTAKCIEMYEAEARTMQASLPSFPSNEPREETAKYWALNDVGACLFIRGEILLQQGDQAGAKAAFLKLRDDLGFAQCWDPRGWYWKPAEAAKQKILEIEYDE